MTEERSRRLAAVMFTDVVGYTGLMQDDEEAARVVRLRHRASLEAAIAAHGGELVQYLGDGSLSTFPSAVRAVSAAVEIQHDRIRRTPTDHQASTPVAWSECSNGAAQSGPNAEAKLSDVR